MNLHPLPPQAYTKDVLIKAYEWLQTQSDSIKQIATSTDILVSLYMKAKLQGEESLHRESIRNFKNDLKSIAAMMGNWDSPQRASDGGANEPRDGHSNSIRVDQASSQSQLQSQLQSHTPTHTPMARSISSPGISQTAAPSSSCASDAGLPKGNVGLLLKHTLNAELYQELLSVQKMLYLNSEEEALKVVLSVGIQGIKRLMKG
ncbi:MAG: hypothetical protein NZ480_02380 [Bdellovibrionaceae bacterium]|nr:hypothetical protein [Pseudobdellovibrionaceae bacterium]MDW8189659.1 hypothetical protein [Pseudobdellovibrionaceae bacterium]